MRRGASENFCAFFTFASPRLATSRKSLRYKKTKRLQENRVWNDVGVSLTLHWKQSWCHLALRATTALSRIGFVHPLHRSANLSWKQVEQTGSPFLSLNVCPARLFLQLVHTKWSSCQSLSIALITFYKTNIFLKFVLRLGFECLNSPPWWGACRRRISSGRTWRNLPHRLARPRAVWSCSPWWVACIWCRRSARGGIFSRGRTRPTHIIYQRFCKQSWQTSPRGNLNIKFYACCNRRCIFECWKAARTHLALDGFLASCAFTLKQKQQKVLKLHCAIIKNKNKLRSWWTYHFFFVLASVRLPIYCATWNFARSVWKIGEGVLWKRRGARHTLFYPGIDLRALFYFRRLVRMGWRGSSATSWGWYAMVAGKVLNWNGWSRCMIDWRRGWGRGRTRKRRRSCWGRWKRKTTGKFLMPRRRGTRKSKWWI